MLSPEERAGLGGQQRLCEEAALFRPNLRDGGGPGPQPHAYSQPVRMLSVSQWEAMSMEKPMASAMCVVPACASHQPCRHSGTEMCTGLTSTASRGDGQRGRTKAILYH